MPKHANDRALDTVNLRDYFAAMALTGLADRIPVPLDARQIAHWCYDLADAMLVERESREDADDVQ